MVERERPHFAFREKARLPRSTVTKQLSFRASAPACRCSPAPTVTPQPPRDSVRYRHSTLLLPTLVCLSALFGCGREEPITRYPVPKLSKSASVTKDDRDPVKPPPLEDRMLGAIIPRGSQVWYLKLVGPIDDVDPIAAAFREFISSVNFSLDDGTSPDWTLPEGWNRLPDDAPQNNGMFKRYATLMIDTGSKPLELSITTLGGGNNQMALLANVNRWRDQMSWGEIGAGELARIEQISLTGGAKATVIDLKGKFKTNPRGRAPFMNR